MTLDNVELTFDAAICIRVIDAQKAVTMLAAGGGGGNVVEEMFANVQERAKLDLCTIIGKNRFNKKHVATTAPTPRPASRRWRRSRRTRASARPCMTTFMVLF